MPDIGTNLQTDELFKFEAVLFWDFHPVLLHLPYQNIKNIFTSKSYHVKQGKYGGEFPWSKEERQVEIPS